MENSHIEWTDHTFNPWEGCSKVSPGCANCYAEARNHRWGNDNWGKEKPRRRTSEANWKQPIKWNNIAICDECGAEQSIAATAGNLGKCKVCDKYKMRNPRVFCASLADWLDDEIPIEWLTDLLNLIFETQNLDWLLLTKRPENWLRRMELAHCEPWLTLHFPKNVWIGTSVENQAMVDKRIPELLKIPAKIRFLSVEPMLGPMDVATWFWSMMEARRDGVKCAIDWVICGCESGRKRRPMSENWSRSLKDQCEAAHVAFFMKQMQMAGKVTGDIDQFPEDLRVRKSPK